MRTTDAGSSPPPPLSPSPAPCPLASTLTPLVTIAVSTMVKRTATGLPPASEEEEKESGISAAEAISSRAFFDVDLSESKSSEPLQAAPLAVPIVEASDPRRRRTYGQQRVSEDHKRERNRETFRRFYKRKQDTLRELREQEDQLTQQYELLKLAHPEIALDAGSADCQPSDSLVQLITHKDRVSAEQSVLQRVAQEQLRIRRQLGRIAGAFQDEDDQDAIDQAAPQFLVPPAPLDVDANLQDAIGQLSAMQLITEISQREDAFGWQCWSQRQGEYVAFHVAKQFLAIALTPKQAARRTWEFYSESKASGSSEPSPSRVAPSSMVRMRRRVLSTPDQNSRLVFRRLTRVHRERTSSSSNSDGPPGDRPLRMTKSVYHVTLKPLANTTDGFAVVSHSVPNQEIYEPVDADILEALGDIGHPHTRATMLGDELDLEILVGAAPREVLEEWIRELSWWRVEPSESGMTVSFAGFAPLCLVLTPSACFMEVLRLAVQWEHVVLGETPISCLAR